MMLYYVAGVNPSQSNLIQAVDVGEMSGNAKKMRSYGVTREKSAVINQQGALM